MNKYIEIIKVLAVIAGILIVSVVSALIRTSEDKGTSEIAYEQSDNNEPTPLPTDTPEIPACPYNLREATYALQRAFKKYQVVMESPLDNPSFEPANTLHYRKAEAIEILNEAKCFDDEGREELRDTVDEIDDYMIEARKKISQGLQDFRER